MIKKLSTLVVVTLVMINCGIKASAQEPMRVEEFWIEFLSTLKKGDVNQIKLISTERGFKSLVRERNPDEYLDWLTNLGNSFDNKEIAWNHKSEEETILSIGIIDDIRSVYPTGLKFVKIDGNWKFDLLLGAK